MRVGKGVKKTIDEISHSIKVTMNNVKWEVLDEPYDISKYEYKDGVGTLTGVNDEYVISVTAKHHFDKAERDKFPWKISMYDVSISIDEHEIMSIVVCSGTQYPLASQYVSEFVFSKLWTKHCSTLTDEQKLNWF